MANAHIPQQRHLPSRPSWLKILLLILVGEKIVQHIVVTLAFYFDWAGIGATVAVNPRLLMVLGALVASAFTLSLWGLLTQRNGAIDLVIVLALFDIAGEFVAQGRLAIEVTVSFLVAVLLLILALVYRRRTTFAA